MICSKLYARQPITYRVCTRGPVSIAGMDYLQTLRELYSDGPNAAKIATEVFTHLLVEHPERAAAWAMHAVISLEARETVDVDAAGEIAAKPKLAYTVAETAEQLGVSRATVYRWMRNGEIGAVRAGGVTLIPGAELIAWLRGLPSWEPGTEQFNKSRRPKHT